MDFRQVKVIGINEGVVKRVLDSLGRVLWEQGEHDYSQDYFFIEDKSGSANTVTIKKSVSNAPTITVYKSTDGSTWQSMGSTSTTAITTTIPANGKLYLKATTNAWWSSFYYNTITASGNHNVGGNIMSLLYGDGFKNKTEFPSESTHNFHSLFYNNNKLVSASNLALPATTLTQGCYQSMFTNCTSLTAAPELPATTLANNCYGSMFQSCTSLTTAPELPATTLMYECYRSMFWQCTSLTTAPALPVTTLADYCYYGMFLGCTSLTTAPELPATTLANYCYHGMFSGCTNLNKVTTYAQDISASYCTNNWLSNVAATGDFYNLGGATYTIDSPSGIPTGWTEHKEIPIETYFYVEDVSGSDNTVSIKNSGNAPIIEVYKSTDGNTWQSMGSTSATKAITATIPANGRLYLKARANTWGYMTSGNILTSNYITTSGKYNVGGNIMSLLYADDFEGQTVLSDTLNKYAFFYLFGKEDYGNLINAKDLILPATELSQYCYNGMFDGCYNLVSAPELPAKELVGYCYCYMFRGCSKLKTIVVYAERNTAVIGNPLLAWVKNVSRTGDFYNLGNYSFGTGDSGIPSGWTEHTSL